MAVMMAGREREYSYETLAEALLKLLADGDDHPLATTIPHLATSLNLSPRARSEKMAAGIPRLNYAVYRLHRFLTRIDFIQKVRPGVYRMSLAGQAFVERSSTLNLATLQHFYRNARAGDATQPYQTTPSLRQQLQTALAQSAPDTFRQLILELLKAMNYQGSFEGNTEIIDHDNCYLHGMIREDRLGLKDVIYVQAYRSASESAVQQAHMQTFIEGMQTHETRRGIFLTNTHFVTAARHLAETHPRSLQVALIDGEFLVQLLIEYRVGIKDVQQITQVIDPDFFIQD